MSLKDLPFDKGKRIYKVFERLGFELKGRSEKNHFILKRPDNPYLFISIPDHKEVDRSTLHAEVKKAGISDSKFREHYDAMYAKSDDQPKPLASVVAIDAVADVCPFCREDMTETDDKILQENGLRAHKACHEKQFGATASSD